MRLERLIYLDCAATTPVDARVADLILRLMTEEFGNAGSRTHLYGEAALRVVWEARERIAGAVGAVSDEVIFTSGATESDNLAILGLAPFGRAEAKQHIVSTAIEHKAVLEPLASLADDGFEVTHIPPDRQGYVDPRDILAAVRPDTVLVSIMHANNETGALQPIAEVADKLPAAPYFHVDAAQTFGRETATLRHNRIDLISLSAHKVFGPKGIGALIARRREGRRPPLTPVMRGGGQERGLRAGTLPVPLIAGFGLAADLAEKERGQRREACLAIRRQAIEAFSRLGALFHADPERGVLPHILSLAVPGLDSEAVMVALKHEVAISNGSACTSSSYSPSHVLTAMGLTPEEIGGTIRLSWSHVTKPVPWEAIIATLERLRLPFNVAL